MRAQERVTLAESELRRKVTPNREVVGVKCKSTEWRNLQSLLIPGFRAWAASGLLKPRTKPAERG